MIDTNQDRFQYIILNIGHFFDHMVILVFSAAAAIVLHQQWHMSYADLLPYATPGLVAFGLFSYPAGWLADRWSKDGMLYIFFIGLGMSTILTGFSQSPLQISVGLFFVGAFAAIYHPVALALITTKWSNIGARIAINGLWGNIGVASAALITGLLIDLISWRVAYILPGTLSLLLGVSYMLVRCKQVKKIGSSSVSSTKTTVEKIDLPKAPNNGVFFTHIVITALIITTLASMIFQFVTFVLPEIIKQQLQDIVLALSQLIGQTGSDLFATSIGLLTFIVFAIASVSQLLVGWLIDKHSPKHLLIVSAFAQCFSIMLLTAFNELIGFLMVIIFMIATFSQVTINDYLLAKTSSSHSRARVYGLRYVFAFSASALTIPTISFIYSAWGLQQLFYVLASLAFMLMISAYFLPKTAVAHESN